MQFLDILDQLLQARGNRIASFTGVVSVKGVENDGFVPVLVFKVTLHHGKFIKICEQGQILSVHGKSPLIIMFYSE